jgi:hypothetical protein
MKNNRSPAAEVASKQTGRLDTTVTLADGRKAKVVPVSATLIDEVTSHIKDPKVPIWHNEDKHRDEPNPDDPVYQEGLDDARRQRGVAAIDAMVMFGLELEDGLPEDDAWIKKLEFMQKRGLLDLSGYDLRDDMDREFLYKRFVAADASVLEVVTRISGISGEAIAEAESSFQRP